MRASIEPNMQCTCSAVALFLGGLNVHVLMRCPAVLGKPDFSSVQTLMADIITFVGKTRFPKKLTHGISNNLASIAERLPTSSTANSQILPKHVCARGMMARPAPILH